VPGLTRVSKTDDRGRNWVYVLPDLEMCRQHLERTTGTVVHIDRDIHDFIRECLISAPGEKVVATALFGAYQRWGQRNQRLCRSQTRFGLAMLNLGYQKVKQGSVYYLDVAFIEG